MTEASTTPCSHTKADYDAIADTQYHQFRKGLNDIIATHAQTISVEIANSETNDVLRLVRVGGNIFEAFLSGIDESIRQQYNCRTCAQFFNGYGSLALLTQDLKIVPLAFPSDEAVWLPLTGEVFEKAYRNVLAAFEVASVIPMTVGIYQDMGDFLGTAERGGFTHFHQSDILNTRQFLESLLKNTAELGHSFGPAETVQIHDAFRKYNDLLIDKSFPIPKDRLRERDVYELELCIRMTTDYMAQEPTKRNLWTTRYLMDLGLGIVHFKNSVVGILIDDIQTLDVEEAMNNYYAFTDPTKYKRKVALPSEREFEASVAFLNENDYTRKLELRFATFAESKAEMDWLPPMRTLDAFAALRKKVKTEEDARNLSLAPESISILGFNHVLNKLIAEGKLKTIAYKSDILQYGVLSRNVADDAGDVYVHGKVVHPMYMSEPVAVAHNYLQFDSSQVDGIIKTKTSHGVEVVVLAFGSATINLGIRSLNYVEELIPDLRPHQRVIDTWCNTMYLNPTSPAGKPLPVTDMVVLIPAVVNKHAVISLVTEDVVQEFIITSER